MEKILIVNADDFGLSAGVNRGIIECIEHGIVTSASLMVRWPAAPEAAAHAKQNQSFSLGLHVDLAEWVLRDGDWQPLYQVVDARDRAAVTGEIYRQLETFRSLVGAPPSHLDSHQHVHREDPARSIMVELADELGVPLREFTPGLRYFGGFYGQGAEGESLPDLLTIANLQKILKSLPPGITELGCHPGYGDDLRSPYRLERAMEVRALCDPAARVAVVSAGFHLGNFKEARSEACGTTKSPAQ